MDEVKKKCGKSKKAKMHSCVDQVQDQGKSEDSAYAICTDSIDKAWKEYKNLKKKFPDEYEHNHPPEGYDSTSSEHPDPDAEYDALQEREYEDSTMNDYKNSPEYDAELNYDRQVEAAARKREKAQAKADKIRFQEEI